MKYSLALFGSMVIIYSNRSFVIFITTILILFSGINILPGIVSSANSLPNTHSSFFSSYAAYPTNGILTMDNITHIVSFIGEVNTSHLARTQFNPYVDINAHESYLTKDYADYKIAKNQSELVRPSTNVFEVRLPSSFSSSIINFHTDTSSKQINPSSSRSLIGFEGLAQNCCSPPDIQIAAGEGSSNYVVEMVNLDGAIYTKSGTLVKAFDLHQFFSPSNNSFSKSNNDDFTDPSLLFDNLSGRWFAAISDTTTQSVRVAVSKTNDPTAVWRVYDFHIKLSQPDSCSDQPFIGVSKDKFIFTINNWSNNCNWYSDNSPPKFRGVQFSIADKQDLVDGVNHVRSVQSRPDLSYFSLHPVLTMSPTSALIIVTVGDFNHNNLQTIYIDGNSIYNLYFRISSNSIQTTHIAADGIQPIIIVNHTRQQQLQQQQLTKEPKVSTGDARIQSASWYQGKLWIAFNDGCFPNGDIKSRSCIRFIQLNTNTNNNTTNNRVIQDFDVAAVGSSLYYPALAIDRAGNVGVIFGYSSQFVYPSLLVSMRLVNDAPNTIEQPLLLKLGTENELSNRYGDYFGAFTDPSSNDSPIIWVAGQYHAMNTWSTYIGLVHTLRK